jgi:hypothetical protein
VQKRIESAAQLAQKEFQSDLTLVLQFFHLHSLFTSGNSPGFAPAVLPPVVANATGQQSAAVFALYDALVNGPLLGGHDDALDKIRKLKGGEQDQVSTSGVGCSLLLALLVCVLLTFCV